MECASALLQLQSYNRCARCICTVTPGGLHCHGDCSSKRWLLHPLYLVAAVQLALKLNQHQQLELWARLGNVLMNDGLLPGSLEGSMQTALHLANSTSTVHSTPFFS